MIRGSRVCLSLLLVAVMQAPLTAYSQEKRDAQLGIDQGAVTGAAADAVSGKQLEEALASDVANSANPAEAKSAAANLAQGGSVAAETNRLNADSSKLSSLQWDAAFSGIAVKPAPPAGSIAQTNQLLHAADRGIDLGRTGTENRIFNGQKRLRIGG